MLKGSFIPLENIQELRDEYLFYSGQTLNAVRIDNWKLVFPHLLSSNVGSTIGQDGWPDKLKKVQTEGVFLIFVVTQEKVII